jgi:hypothetical protein
LIEKILLSGKYDYVVWIDADGHIMNDEITLEHYINKHLDKSNIHILASTEWNNPGLCASTLFLKNSPFVLDLLKDIWDNPSEFDKNFHEQASLIDLHKRNVKNCREHILILPQNEFLAFWYAYQPKKTFIFYAARCAHDRPGFIFTMDSHCPIKLDEETDDEFKIRKQRLDDPDICAQVIQHYKNGVMRLNPSRRCETYEPTLTFEF